MNCHLDGRLLSTDDLFAIAVEHGADAQTLNNLRGALHCEAMFRSDLTRLTAAARFAMFTAGLLRLDTRTAANSGNFTNNDR